jgi:membrane protease YdiL (CAAX protease family)
MLPEKPWRLESLLRFLLCISFLPLLVWLSAALIQSAGLGDRTKIATLMASMVVFQGGSLYLVYRFLREHSISWADAFGLNTASLGRTLLLAFISALVILPVALLLVRASAEVMTWLHFEPMEQQSVQMLKASDSLAERVIFAFVAIISAPVVEELLFRGIIYPALKRTGHPSMALWGSSALFALMHVNVVTFVSLTLLGALLALLYERTTNLLAPITVHALFNAANYLFVTQQGLQARS